MGCVDSLSKKEKQNYGCPKTEQQATSGVYNEKMGKRKLSLPNKVFPNESKTPKGQREPKKGYVFLNCMKWKGVLSFQIFH